MSLELATEFLLKPQVIYLNHAAVAPWPLRTCEVVKNFAEENLHQGSKAYAQWMERETELREQLRRLINAPSTDDIALLKNTSEALSIIAYGLDWQPGDNIIITDQEFPSNRIVWESLKNQGVEVRIISVMGEEDPEAMLMGAADAHTRLMSVSSVQYACGLQLRLKCLGDFCQRQGIIFVVDAIQSLGAIRFDVQQIQADFVVADGHKWMLGPEGLALFYCRPEWRERLKLTQFGWHMTEDYLNFDNKNWQPASTARRFECGSPNMLGVHALSASLSLLEEVGMEQVEAQVLDNARYLLQQLRSMPDIEILSAGIEGRFAGIVTFRHPAIEAEQLFRQLSAKGVICACRGGGVRFSPHFHNTREHLDQALTQVQALIA